MADLADLAAATSAGYEEIVLDRGSTWTASSRFTATLEKQLVGAGARAACFCAFGVGASQAAAETAGPGRPEREAAAALQRATDSFGATLTPDLS